MTGLVGAQVARGSTISQKREYVFTEWDPTAQTDMQALRARFDSNGDGKLTAADTDFGKVKGVVTGANGSTSVQTLAALGIVEIKLTEDATRVVLAEGSVGQEQSTYLMNGVTRTAASTLPMAEAPGNKVVESKQAKFEKAPSKVQNFRSCRLIFFIAFDLKAVKLKKYDCVN